MFKLYGALINTESKYRYRQHRKTDPNPGLSCPEAQNRYVEELQHSDPDCSPDRRDFPNHTSVGRPYVILPSTEETRASQPRTQSNLMNNHSEDFIPLDKRKWNDILADGEVKRRPLEYRISTKVTSLVRHLDLKDRETDGAVHWASVGPKLRQEFQKSGHTFSDAQWLDYIWKAIKLEFNIARTPTTFY